MEGLRYPHEDALLISPRISNANVIRVIIDTSISVEILFALAFHKMNLKNSDLEPCSSPLVGFNGQATLALGKIKLPVSLGIVIVMVNFLVV